MSILLRKIGQTVFPEIAPAVLAFTLVAVAVTVGCEVSGFAMKVNTIMLRCVVFLSRPPSSLACSRLVGTDVPTRNGTAS